MKLTEICRIIDLQPIEGADRIERATVLGWQCVVKKGLHQVGDMVVFVFPDTKIPKKFLDESYEGDEKIRLRTVKMRGQYSAGLVIPLAVLPEGTQAEEGNDVAEHLNIEKYIKQLPTSMSGEAQGNFPSHIISKTDEDNLRSAPEAVDELKNYEGEIVLSMKVDGTSFTAILHQNTFHVCSRNLELKDSAKSIYWQVAQQYKIQEKLRLAGGHWAIQAEVYGSGINGNALGELEHKLAVFHVKNLDDNCLLSPKEVKEWCDTNLLPSVEIVCTITSKNFIRDFKTGELQKYINRLTYPNGLPAEGVVCKTDKAFPCAAFGKSYWSGKILNENYSD